MKTKQKLVDLVYLDSKQLESDLKKEYWSKIDIWSKWMDVKLEGTLHTEILIEEQSELLNACERHIDRMDKLINKILDVRQLETGKIVLKKDKHPANNIVEDAAHSLDSWAQDKNITIAINTIPLPEVYCDPERIYQIITNLISNALKFTPDGGCIRVKGTTVEVENIDCIEVSVTDSGMGISPEDLERIFNKYEQVGLKHPGPRR
jgi:signal transduction histidine kinase